MTTYAVAAIILAAGLVPLAYARGLRAGRDRERERTIQATAFAAFVFRSLRTQREGQVLRVELRRRSVGWGAGPHRFTASISVTPGINVVHTGDAGEEAGQ